MFFDHPVGAEGLQIMINNYEKRIGIFSNPI